ncbi:cytochrome P450 [Actinokineospora baliensis]|uniref:cytochrome P450 n=1 Tax=Actinokineospora baliensis TaxID=547056 RepID=UPI001957746C|nr:cytochrome P450 [Actinokineospora baliensis]MBM7776197.1 cytochrome P450 [Actinokineospora baliensis]
MVRELAVAPAGLKPVMGDSGWPVLGHTVPMLRRGVDLQLERYRRYGPVSWANMFGTKMVAAVGPEAAREVFVNKDKAFSQDGWAFFLEKFFPRGLMLLDFDEHLFHRRLMQEAFTAPRVSAYVARTAEVVHREIPTWPEHLDVYPALKSLTLDVAAEVFMGEPSDPRLNEAFIGVVRAGTSIVRFPVPGGRWSAGLRGRRRLEEYFRAGMSQERVGDDLFTALCHARLEDGSTFSQEDVVNHMIFLMMAAHDTATITTTAVLYHLGLHPEWQEQAREEARAVCSGPLPVADLDRLEVLDMVIRESLRLVTPVPSPARRAIADTEIQGHFVPAGTLVAVTLWLNHLLPEYWPDPHRFDPLRFAGEIPRYNWLPFGAGAHKCIGLRFGMYEVKTLLHQLLLSRRWHLPPGYEVRWDPTALPVPMDNLPMTLTRT